MRGERARFKSSTVHGLLLALAFSLAAAGSPNPTLAAETKPAAGSGGFEAQWQSLIAAARKEERFTVDAGTGNAPHWRPIVQWFGKKFGIRAVTASGDNVAERIVAEQRGGRYLANVVFESNRGGNTMLIPAKAVQPIGPLLIHPEVVDQKKWWQGRWWWSDDEETHMFNFAAEAHDSPIADLYINTALVKPEKIKNREKFTFWDILDPEQPWAGKIMSEPPSGGLMSRWGRTLLVPELGEKWVRAMITHPKIKWQTNRRLQVDGLFSGEYALTIMTTGTTQRSMDQLRARGAPFKRLLEVVALAQSRTIGGAGNHGQIMVAKNPASPNATKLFVNWLLSWEGQKIRQELAEGEPPPPTLRIDNVPVGKVRPQDQIKPGLKYIMVFGSKEVESEVERGRTLAGDIWKCVQLKGHSNC